MFVLWLLIERVMYDPSSEWITIDVWSVDTESAMLSKPLFASCFTLPTIPPSLLLSSPSAKLYNPLHCAENFECFTPALYHSAP